MLANTSAPPLQAIIRDDDTSYFTTPAMLEAVYGPVWARGVCVSLAVIPAHQGMTRVMHRRGRPYDPNVPPKFRGNPQHFTVDANSELCRFLLQQVERGVVEILLHGYDHAYHEFAITDIHAIERKLDAGVAIFQRAFPGIPIRGFIAPYDRISRQALDAVLDRGWDLCIRSDNLRGLAGLEAATGYQGYRLSNGRQIFTCDEYLFNRLDTPEQCTAAAMSRIDIETLVVANHYWMMYANWNRLRPGMVEGWTKFFETLVAQGRTFTTFSEARASRTTSYLPPPHSSTT